MGPVVWRLSVQHEREWRGQWGIHRHLQEHPGGGPQAYAAALQDTYAGSVNHLALGETLIRNHKS